LSHRHIVLFNNNDKGFKGLCPVINKFCVGGGVANAHVGSGRGAQRGGVLDEFRARFVHGYAVNVAPVAEATSIGGKSPVLVGAVLIIIHFKQFVLQHENTEWSLPFVGWGLETGGGRVDTANEPKGVGILQGGDVLVRAIDEDDFMESGRVELLHVFPGHEPHARECQGADGEPGCAILHDGHERSVPSVTFGETSALLGIERDGLMSGDPPRVSCGAVRIRLSVTDKRRKSLFVFIILKDSENNVFLLKVSEGIEFLADLIPLKHVKALPHPGRVVEGVMVEQEGFF